MTAAIRAIQALVAADFGMTREELLARSYARRVTRPRQIAMAIVREQELWSLPRIAATFERDHTCVIHALRRVHAYEVGGVREMCEPLVRLRTLAARLPEVEAARRLALRMAADGERFARPRVGLARRIAGGAHAA
jgi:hypothetical protein